jgi:hypothetical protein
MQLWAFCGFCGQVAKSDRILLHFIIPDVQCYKCCKYVYRNIILLGFYSSEGLCSSLDAVVNYCKQYLCLLVCSVIWFRVVLLYVTCTLLKMQFFGAQYIHLVMQTYLRTVEIFQVFMAVVDQMMVVFWFLHCIVIKYSIFKIYVIFKKVP